MACCNRVSAFQPPDWTQPLRDIEADKWETAFGKDQFSLEGHVRLSLDKMNFAADKFWYNEPAGEMRAAGNVVIVEDPATITAEEIYYKVPDPSQLPVTSPLRPALDEQQVAKLRLSSGSVSGTNVTLDQPGQKLLADHLDYDLLSSKGELENARGASGIYYFGARKLHILGPASMDGEDMWVTTCDHDPPHYKLRVKKLMIREGEAVYGEGAQLYIADKKTPLYWPRWGYKSGEAGTPLNFDFKSGHRAGVGYFVNTGQQFSINEDVRLGVRFYPTTRQGIGLGVETEYDFTKTPASPLFLGKGSFASLYTTNDRGYMDLYHRQEILDNTILLLQVEEWSDKDFYKDFFYDQYRNRSAPRSFVNVTHTTPDSIITGTIRPDTNGFVHETEQLPEVAYHLLERPVAENLYVSFDSINGYNKRAHEIDEAARSVNVARLTYDWNIDEALDVTPFYEVESSWYSQGHGAGDGGFRLVNTLGTTAQTRFHRAYPGMAGFSGFKHVVLPSVTYSYRPSPTLSAGDTPFFDSYDVANGRSRVETKLDNVLFGRDAETQEVWQVARLTLYQGNDFWNEIRRAADYEAELDLRPRSWLGWMTVAERHNFDETLGANPESPNAKDTVLHLYDRLSGKTPVYDPNNPNESDTNPHGDYNRVLTYLYYEDIFSQTHLNARVGFSYTETQNVVFNRQVIYGLGYRLGENWGVAFEHRFDFETGALAQQRYEIRRNLHCWEVALTFRERQSGWDVGVSFNIAAFSGNKTKF